MCRTLLKELIKEMARRDLNKIYLNPKPPFGLPDAAPSILQILFVLSKKIGGVDTYPSSA